MTLFVAHQDELPPRASLDRIGVRAWLYAGDDSAWRVAAEHGDLAGLERVQTADALQEAVWALRRPYLDWVGELSQRNASLAWWCTELAAKSSATFLLNRLASLAALTALLPSLPEGTLLVCSTGALVAEAERAAATASRATVRVGTRRTRPLAARARARARGVAWTGYRAWAAAAPARLAGLPALLDPTAAGALGASPSYRRKVLSVRGVRPEPFAGDDTVLLLSWADERNASAGRYHDPHLGVLPDLLEAHGRRVAIVPRVLAWAPFDRVVDALLATGRRFVFPDLVTDGLGHIAPYAPAIPAGSRVAGVPVEALAREHLAEFAHRVRLNLEHAALARGLARNGIRPGAIVYTHEGHAWEQAFIHEARAHLPQTTIVGYENANMSRLALSMFPARSELGLRPLPDRLVTNGPAYARVLEEEGFPRERIRVGCGVRHAYVWERVAGSTPRRTEGAMRVLVATEILEGQAVELVTKAVAALSDDARFEVTVKAHPLIGRRAVECVVHGANVRLSEDPLAELLQHADVLLHTHSIVPYEAFAHGVPTVYVRSETFHDLDQLEPFPDLRREARTPGEIRAEVERVAAAGDEELAAWRQKAADAVREVLAPCTADSAGAWLDPDYHHPS